MTSAILVCFHKYTPFGGEYYESLLDFFLTSMKKYQDEYDMIYLLDSTWNIDPTKLEGMKAKIIKVDPSLRYYDAYKVVLPQIKEELVLFLDNDMVIYKPKVIQSAFTSLESWGQDMDVVSIMDTIGTYTTKHLTLGNKLCPYFFAAKKAVLMKYLDIEWGSHMPHSETFGLLTEAMVNDRVRIKELEDDKTEVRSWEPLETEKKFGFYHIRAGSTIAYLLATKHYGDIKTYEDYLKYQPNSEITRHMKWYKYMRGDPKEILEDLNAKES